jgi:hypothetical protein
MREKVTSLEQAATIVKDGATPRPDDCNDRQCSDGIPA